MDLGCVVGDAWELLANIRGNRCYPGSCALKALPNVQEGHVGTSLGLVAVGMGSAWSVVSTVCCVGEVTADVS
jgi:hypothetical protein